MGYLGYLVSPFPRCKEHLEDHLRDTYALSMTME